MPANNFSSAHVWRRSNATSFVCGQDERTVWVQHRRDEQKECEVCIEQYLLPINIITQGGRWSILIETNNPGWSTYRSDSWWNPIVFRDGKGKPYVEWVCWTIWKVKAEETLTLTNFPLSLNCFSENRRLWSAIESYISMITVSAIYSFTPTHTVISYFLHTSLNCCTNWYTEHYCGTKNAITHIKINTGNSRCSAVGW